MKKKTILSLLLAGACLVFTFYNCSKNQQSGIAAKTNSDEQVLPDRPNLNFTATVETGIRSISPEHDLNGHANASRTVGSSDLRTAGCGGSFSGSWGTTGYHQYARDTIKVDTLTRTLHINMNAYDVPNRFTVYDSLNNIVAASPWMGYANYSGPWGLSINTATTGTLNFSRGAYTKFTLLVETSVKTTSDTYIANVSCN
jgi:hypothetical protein